MTAAEYTKQLAAKIKATEIIQAAIAKAHDLMTSEGMDPGDADDAITEIFELERK